MIQSFSIIEHWSYFLCVVIFWLGRRFEGSKGRGVEGSEGFSCLHRSRRITVPPHGRQRPTHARSPTADPRQVSTPPRLYFSPWVTIQVRPSRWKMPSKGSQVARARDIDGVWELVLSHEGLHKGPPRRTVAASKDLHVRMASPPLPPPEATEATETHTI